jgi:hypothetical protein
MKLGLVLLALCFASTAHADWQYTKWGMTVDEVVAASGGKAVPNTDNVFNMDDPNLATKLSTPYAVDTVEFAAHFLFDPQGKLGLVHLRPIDAQNCFRLKSELANKYGRPSNITDLGVVRNTYWRDTESSNLVQFVEVKSRQGSCMLKYGPLKSTMSRGL